MSINKLATKQRGYIVGFLIVDLREYECLEAASKPKAPMTYFNITSENI